MTKFILLIDKINPDNLELFKKQPINYDPLIFFVGFGEGRNIH